MAFVPDKKSRFTPDASSRFVPDEAGKAKESGFKNRIINSLIGATGAGGAGLVGEVFSERSPIETAKTYLKAAPTVAQIASIPLTGGASALPTAGLGARLMAQLPGIAQRAGVYAVSEALGRGVRKAIGDESVNAGDFAKDVGVNTAIDTALTMTGTAIAPKLKELAVKMMTNYLRPSKKLAENAAGAREMAENALEYGIKGDYDSATMKAARLAQKTTGDVDKIIDQYANLPGDIKKPLSYINKASEEARKGLNYSRADDLLANRALIESNEGFAKDIPIFADVPTSVGQPNQFVIPRGATSVSVKPTVQNVPLAGKKKASILATLNEQIGNISKKSLEKADDVILTPKSNKNIQMVSPERTVSTRSSSVYGPDQETRLVKTQIGSKKEYAPVSVGKMQALKRDIYSELGSQPFSAEAKIATEKEARKAFASGLRQEIEDVVTDKKVKGLNKRISSLLDIVQSLEDRGLVDARSNPLGLADVILGGGALSGKSPELGIIAALRKIISSPSLYSRSAHGVNTLTKGMPAQYIAKAISELATQNN